MLVARLGAGTVTACGWCFQAACSTGQPRRETHWGTMLFVPTSLPYCIMVPLSGVGNASLLEAEAVCWGAKSS